MTMAFELGPKLAREVESQVPAAAFRQREEETPAVSGTCRAALLSPLPAAVLNPSPCRCVVGALGQWRARRHGRPLVAGAGSAWITYNQLPPSCGGGGAAGSTGLSLRAVGRGARLCPFLPW